MLGTIFAWLGSSALRGIVGEISSLWQSYLDAKSTEAKAEIMERIKALQAIRDVQVAESGEKITAWMRVLSAAPFVAYAWKLVVWDKIIMGGATSTDDLSQNLWYLMLVVYGFLFLHWTVGRITGK